MIRLFLLFSFVLLPSITLGQSLSAVLDATEWMSTLQSQADTYDSGITLVSRALFALGFIGSVLAIMVTRGGAGASVSLVIRAAAVLMIFSSTLGIRELTTSSWTELQAWSLAELEQVFEEGAEEMRELGSDAASFLMLASAPTQATSMTLYGLGRLSGWAATKRYIGINASRLTFWLNACILPILFFVVTAYLIMLLSALTVAFGNIMLPISASMLMFSPAQGERWLGMYLSALLSALLIVALMPIAFNAAFRFAIIEPVRIVNENFESGEPYYDLVFGSEIPPNLEGIQQRIAEGEAELASLEADARQAAPGSSASVLNWGPIQAARAKIASAKEQFGNEVIEFFRQSIDEAGSVLLGAALDLRNMFMRLVLLIVGAALGAHFLFSSSGIISSLVGGAAFGISRRLAQPAALVRTTALTSGNRWHGSSYQASRPLATQNNQASASSTDATTGIDRASTAVGPVEPQR